MAPKRTLEDRQNYDLQIEAAINHANQNPNISKRQVSSLYGIPLSTLCDQFNSTQTRALGGEPLQQL